ncbi:MAG TPA: hypothetical protein VHG72_02100 [Polyangia bacterium]|nr:hypothetical protein [Polyangia bacterium]
MRMLSLLIVILGGGAVAAGCDGKCSGTYNCPAGIPYATLSAAGLPSALVDVSADSPCTATLQGGDGGASSVSLVDNDFTQTLTCQVHGRLADGRAVAATVTFHATTVSCCGSYDATGDAFTLADASTDGP